VNETRKDGAEPGGLLEDRRLSGHPGKRMRTPADMLQLTPEVRRELIANRARFLWQQKGLLPELEADCWVDAEAEFARNV
jgi:hypothetical protein